MKRLLIALLTLALLAVACSTDTTIDAGAVSDAADDLLEPTPDDSDEGDDADDQGNGDDAEQLAPTAPPAPEPTAIPQASSNDLLGSDDWCTAALRVEENFDELDLVNFQDPEALERVYTSALALIAQAQRIAPPQIAGDVAKALEGLSIFVGALEDADWSFLDVDLAVLDSISQEQEVATFNIEKYNFEVCGIDNGFDPSDDPALRPDIGGDDDDDLPTQGTPRDLAVQGLVEAGFTADEASCILESLDISNPEAFADTTALLSVFTECGISLERLGQLGG